MLLTLLELCDILQGYILDIEEDDKQEKVILAKRKAHH